MATSCTRRFLSRHSDVQDLTTSLPPGALLIKLAPEKGSARREGKMRFYLGALIAFGMIVTVPVQVAAQDTAGDGWLFGYLDPRTNVFTAAEAPAADPVAAEVNIGGTLRIEITFQIRSAIPQ